MYAYSDELRGLAYLPRSRESFQNLNQWSIWISKWCGKKAGTRASFRRGKKPRYTSIKVGKKQFYEHLLVLVWHGIQIPNNKEVDHMDNDPTNNSISNLRIVDRSLNVQRQSRFGKPSHAMGVRLHRGKWMARATINKKRYFIGYFNTHQEAEIKRVEFIENKRGEKLNPVPLTGKWNANAWEACEK